MNNLWDVTPVESAIWNPSGPFRERRFGDVARETHSRQLVTETLHFLEQLTHARASSFMWIGPECSLLEVQFRNIEPGAITRYESGLGELDPIHVRRIGSERRRIASLSSQEIKGRPVPRAYREHFRSMGVGDELALVLWQHDRPFACVSLLRGIDDPPFSLTPYNWRAIHRYVETALSYHFRFRYAEIEHCLVNRFELRPRELDVVELILQGKSNGDIAEILGVSLATVKIHVGNVLRKMGVDSRLAVACLVNQLQAH